MKKPSVPKCFGGSQKIFLGCSTSSLAVFYVEQVALNRHVRRHFRLLFLCALPPKMSSQKKFSQWITPATALYYRGGQEKHYSLDSKKRISLVFQPQ